MPPIDWSEVWSLTVSPWELVLRGSVMYWFIFIAFRTLMRRDIGSIAVSDVLFLMLVADAAQNAMAGEYRSFPAGLILVCTILFWSYAFDWLGYQFPWFRKLIEPHPLPLIKDGKLLRKNMRQELITEEELKSQLREQGLENWGQVRQAFMESDGHISVLPYEKKR